ncbi:MAG: hypothetical protein ACRDY6_07945 [Acidimicrobiia bacterium]
MRDGITPDAVEAWPPPVTDEELTALALAADRDAVADDDAVCLYDTLEDTAGLLPAWYMPSARGGTARLTGWRRNVALSTIVSFLTLTAYGLCATYGHVGF